MIIDSDFKDYVSYIDTEAIRKSGDVTYIVDHHLILRGYNKAWVDFATGNNGEKILEEFDIGLSSVCVGEEPVSSFIKKTYERAINNNTVFEMDYECSSPGLYRKFRQTAYPIVKRKGLLIVNCLVEERPHNTDIQSLSKRFFNENGLITQCQNCRKIRDPEDHNRWYWVPELVEKPLPQTSHSICSNCMDFYYPDI